MWNSLREGIQTKERGVKGDLEGEQERTEGSRIRRSNRGVSIIKAHACGNATVTFKKIFIRITHDEQVIGLKFQIYERMTTLGKFYPDNIIQVMQEIFTLLRQELYISWTEDRKM